MTEEAVVKNTKDPYLVPFVILCGECGSVVQQAVQILTEPTPNVTVRCLAEHCSQKGALLAVKIQKAELL